MSPAVFRESGCRFCFFSREENRMDVHIVSGDGEAKFWLEPDKELASITIIQKSNLRLLKS